MADRSGPRHWRGIARGDTVRGLLAGAARLQRLQALLDERLDDGSGVRIRVRRADDAELALALPSPAWAARLRFRVPQLVRELRDHPEFRSLRTISLSVDPELFTRKPRRDKRRVLPPGAARLLEGLADDAERDPDGQRLARQLRRLARRAGPEPGEGPR